MSERDADPDTDRKAQTYQAKDVRQGEIIPHSRWGRVLYIAGLSAIVVLTVALALQIYAV